MNQQFQMCSYKGHEGNKVKFLCLDVKCERKRSFCFKCLQDNHHSHGQENNKNIYNLKAFESCIKSQLDQLQTQDNKEENDSFVQQCIKIINVVRFQIENISNIFQEFQTKSYIKKYIQSLQCKLETVSKTKLSQVNDEFINELIFMDLDQKRQLIKQEIYEQCGQLLKNTQFLQQLSSKEVEINQSRNSQCEGIQVDQLSKDQCQSPQDQMNLIQGEEDKAQKISMCTKGHERNKIEFICLDAECLQNKLLCSQCNIDNPHKHSVFDHSGLQAQIKQKIDQLQEQVQMADDFFVQRCIRMIRILQQKMNYILDIVQRIQTKPKIQANIFSLQTQLEIIRNTKLQQVDDNFIHQFSNINADFVQEQQSILQEIQNQSDQLMKSILNIKNSSVKEGLVLRIKNYQFETSQACQLNDQQVQSAIISYDLKYIASIHNDKIIKIWNQDYQFIFEHNLDDKVHISKFTDDGRLLYIGSALGLLYCFDLYNNFKQRYRQKIHTHNLLNMFCITNDVILTSSFDAKIIKTNTLQDKQLKVIYAHTQRIDGLDFNRMKDVIVSCSWDNWIKLWNNQNGSLLVQKENEQQQILNQVLFINSDQLVSLDCGNVNIWQIKYDSKELLLINKINDKNQIFNISLVLNQSFILLICEEYIKFYTIQGEYIRQIKHDIKEFQMIRQVQLDSIKSIIVQGQKQLQIFRMKN